MKRIVVTGGNGAVGHAAVTMLRRLGHQVTVVGRSPVAGDSRYRQCDIFDAPALAACCRGADLVLNAAGPSSRIAARVAQAALYQAAAYVDVAGDPPLWRSIATDVTLSTALSQHSCLLGAGLTPGFAAMLPRYAAARLAYVTRVALYGGGIEIFTRTSAQDFIASLDPAREQGKAGWMIADGQLCRAPAQPAVSVPTAQRTFNALPYLSFELEQVAKQLSIRHLAAWSLVAEAQMLSACQQQEEQAIDALMHLSQQLTAQEGEQQHLLMDADGVMAGQSVRLRLQIRFDNSYRLTGSIAALAADQLLRQTTPGLTWLPAVVDSQTLLADLTRHGLLQQCRVDLSPIEQPVFTEGEL